MKVSTCNLKCYTYIFYLILIAAMMNSDLKWDLALCNTSNIPRIVLWSQTCATVKPETGTWMATSCYESRSFLCRERAGQSSFILFFCYILSIRDPRVGMEI